MILDGWGNASHLEASAIEKAHTPYIDTLYKKYPYATLRTDGEHVGLPKGQMGNSEVGHMNLGAGRIVYQDLAKINLAITQNTLKDEKVLTQALTYAKENQKKVHLLGLVSDGGVHSHKNHIKGILDVAKQHELQEVYLHAFTDGRDVDPKSGISHLEDIQEYMTQTTGKLASVIGRYYAMDRDQRWERVAKAYNLLVKGKGEKVTNITEHLEKSYAQNITDEFIEPLVLGDEPVCIEKDDVVIFFNFRTDRGRELTQMLSQEDFEAQNTQKLALHYVTMTNYDATFENINVIFNKENIQETLGEVLEKANKTQLRIAETEKYPHVTFFFSGGQEVPFKGEQRILKNSPKVATYDLQPEMSAFELKDALCEALPKKDLDFVCLNFANGDMVGHTGSMPAAIKACEAVDSCVQQVIDTATENGYTTLVIADHGNCETMQNLDGSPHTAHTTNPVPFICVDQDIKKVTDGILADIAPTVLSLLGVTQPKVMTGKSLV